MDGGVTYRGLYLRRRSAENAFRTCHRRGWEPALVRRFGVWVVEVRMEPAGVSALPAPALSRSQLQASR